MRTSQKTDFRSSKNNFRGHDISQGLDREPPSLSLHFLLLSANAEELTVFQIENTLGVLSLLFLLLYWHVLSPHLILPVKTRIIFKSLNEVFKQTTFGNVKRDNGCRENTGTVN